MKFLTSWTTEAYYAYNKRRFTLSIPFLHSLSATNLSIRYCPTFNKIEIKGEISKPQKAIYNPYIVTDEEEIKTYLK